MEKEVRGGGDGVHGREDHEIGDVPVGERSSGARCPSWFATVGALQWFFCTLSLLPFFFPYPFFFCLGPSPALYVPYKKFLLRVFLSLLTRTPPIFSRTL